MCKVKIRPHFRPQWIVYRAAHRADIESNIKFANAVDIGATVYVGGTLGIWAGGSILYNAGELVASGFEAIPTALPAGAKYATTVVYGSVVIPVSSLTVNNPTVHELLEEALKEPWRQEIIEQLWWK